MQQQHTDQQSQMKQASSTNNNGEIKEAPSPSIDIDLNLNLRSSIHELSQLTHGSRQRNEQKRETVHGYDFMLHASKTPTGKRRFVLEMFHRTLAGC